MDTPFTLLDNGLPNGDCVDDLGARLPELTIFGVAYAAKKGHWTSRRPCAGTAASGEDDRELLAGDNRILFQDKPLGEPAETRRIQRGAVSHFVGSFVNDGMESWIGVDLERLDVIQIARRVFDARCGLTRRFGDPIMDGHFSGFARKWSSEERVEIEVVQRRKLDRDETGAFLCVANAIWSVPPQKAHRLPTSDTALRELFLLDRVFDEPRTFGTLQFSGEMCVYRRDVTNFGSLDWILGELARDIPRYEWSRPEGE